MTYPEGFNADRGPPKNTNIFLGWLDRYVYVDRLHISRADVVPHMRWWEWVWYVGVVVVGSHFAILFCDLLDSWLQHVPVLRWVPFIVVWPVAGLLYWLEYRYLLPAWKSRQTLQGEAWLIGALVIAGGVIFALA